MKHHARILTACVLAATAFESQADNPRIKSDPAGDASLRLTDWGADGETNTGATLPDIISLSIGRWAPANPAASLYEGVFSKESSAHFLRIDLVLGGCINPPGPLNLDGAGYEPFLYGPNPVYGHIELDVDEDRDSGGELGGAASQRFLANVGRFGAMPDSSIAERAVAFGPEIDFDFNTAPQYERSGADFSLVLCGCFTPEIVSEDGDGDGLFEAGETWIVSGRFFERFQAFRTASGLFGGSDFGLWDPVIKLRFSHAKSSDTTTVTLVFPLNQNGAGQMAGAMPQPLDFNVANQTSLAEAIHDLAVQSSSISGAVRTLSMNWRSAVPEDYFEPNRWDASISLATAYIVPETSLYAWTDVGFELETGDFDGNGSTGKPDRFLLEEIIVALDHEDGHDDGAVSLPDPGPNFSVFDTTNNAVISMHDWPGGVADVNADTMVDILDLLDFLDVFSACEGHSLPCIINGISGNFNLDGMIDILDFLDFVEAFGG